MDPKLCSLCSNNSKYLNISYSCGHSFCEACFPYIILDLIQTQGLDQNFYNSSYSKHPCPICHNGVSSLPFPQLIEYFGLNFKDDKKKKNPICYRCEERESESFCHDCQNNFCQVCLNLIHLGSKKFESHRIVSNEENNKSEINFKCTCPAQHFLTMFCCKCQTAACDYCAKVYHDNHDLCDLKKLTFKETSQKKLQILGKEVREFQEKFRIDFKNRIKDYTDDFNQRIDQFIEWLQGIKTENQRRLESELGLLGSQINLINDALIYIEDEMKITNIHPQKKFQLHKIMNNLLSKKNFFSREKKILMKNNSDFPEFEETKQKIILYSMQEINELVKDFKKQAEIKVMDAKLFDDDDDANMEAISFENFLTNPDEILNKNGTLIEKKSFDCKFGKSNLSGSFILSDETILFWAGYYKDENKDEVTFPLIIYNISKMKRAITLMETNKYKITTVGVYPKNEINYSQKKLLYCADISGILSIFEIKNEESFCLKSRIVTGVNGGIMTATVFYDKYNEIENEETSNEFKEDRLYFCVSFLKSEKSLRLYRRKAGLKNKNSEDDGWEFMKINNPTDQLCSVIAFYHDELLSKTRLFIGFTYSIKIYDLSLNQWEKIQFFAEKGLASIDFILRKEEPDSKFKEPLIIRQIIYSQWGHGLSIANIDTGEIILQKVMKNSTGIMDFCFWNLDKEVLILATNNRNTLKILSKNNNAVATIELQLTPVNLIKVLQKIKKENEYIYKEKLAVISGYGDESSIMLYE